MVFYYKSKLIINNIKELMLKFNFIFNVIILIASAFFSIIIVCIFIYNIELVLDVFKNIDSNEMMIRPDFDDYKIYNNEDNKYTKEDLKKVQIGQYRDNGLRPGVDDYYMVDPERTPEFIYNLFEFYWNGMRDLSLNILEFEWRHPKFWDIFALIDNDIYDLYHFYGYNLDSKYSYLFLNNMQCMYSMNRTFIDYLVNFDVFWLDLSWATVYWTTEIQFKHWAPAVYTASGNFQYQDYWWCHIAVYYFWLWFFFIYLILFFLIAFIWEVEYNILKNNPQRETRGVSRSKCGDLITSLVPISWATAIIIHESTDAIDHTDGFGTLDFVIGVRAYQWGWEYYYPNTLKINYEISNDRYIQLGKSYFDNSNNSEYSVNQNLKNVIINKKKNFNILPIYLITNNDLNNEFFNINKFNNFGYSKLCLFNAYKFALKGKAINYNDILTSTSNLTNFNSKKFLSKYISNSTLNQNQVSLPNNKSLKLFKKQYNNFDLNLYSKSYRFSFVNTNLSNLNYFINKNITSLNLNNFFNFKYFSNFFFLNLNFKITSNDLDLIRYTQSNWNSNIKSLDSVFNKINNIFLNNEFINFKDININLSEIKLIYRKKLDFNSFYNKKLNFNLFNFNFFFNNLYADIDSKRLSNNELMEDLYWNFYIDDSLLFSSDSSTTDSFLEKEFIFYWLGRYEWESEKLLNNIFITKNWFKYYDLLNKNLNNNLYINYNSNYKIINTIFKINSSMDLSFNNFKNNSLMIYNKNLNIISYLNNFYNIVTSNTLLINNLKFFTNFLTTYDYLNFSKYNNVNNKFSTNFILTEPLKNINILNSSIWKVFKFSIYDNRWYFNKFSNSFLNQKIPFFTKPSFNHYSIVNKNIHFFTKTYNLNKIFFKYNNIYQSKLFNNINLVSFELPFDLSGECDLFKYSWIDWYNFYSKKEIKYQDIKEYNLNGSKIFLNKYDYTFNGANELNILENYFNRILSNRKNYTPLTNSLKPILLKNNNYSNFWNLKFVLSLDDLYFNDFLEDGFYNKTKLIKQGLVYSYVDCFDKSLLLKNNTTNSNNSFNLFFSNNKNYLSTLGLYNNYYNLITQLNNILIKRINIFKQLINNNSLSYTKFNNYNYYLLNDIILDWKSTFFHNSNINILFEINRSLLYFDFYNKKWNEKFFIDIYKYFDFSVNKKTQYNHMRKSISNMLRLQNDRAVCMPTDTRIQILTWSKDIIHSWAIPSAGIKIDCIPGYSSHKIFNLTLSGIYYGQCMEICGRFHHWMPIVVYFLRRDLFLLWCTNFLNNKKTDYNNINKKLINKLNNITY